MKIFAQLFGFVSKNHYICKIKRIIDHEDLRKSTC